MAVRYGDRPVRVRVLELEPGRTEIPSYVALDGKRLIFGTAAVNAGINVHSLKLALRENKPIAELDGMYPDRAAYHLIEFVVARALEQLKREGRLPPAAVRLEVATNVGCTPAFSYEERIRLRDVCAAAGLNVAMVNLVEEPVAAAFEVARTGLTRDGRTMVIDIGGGTIDVSVLEARNGGTDFVIYATGGIDLAGDKFTDIIVAQLVDAVATARGVAVEDLQLSAAERTALWTRAESAKVDLTRLPSVRVALPTDGSDPTPELELTAEWFTNASRRLVLHLRSYVEGVYRMARLTMDRGGARDPHPGTSIVEARPNGVIEKRLSDLRLVDDGREHLDFVYLVGGASRMTSLREEFEGIFGDKLVDLDLIGMDPVQAVVMGLARHQDLERISMRYPNWAVDATLANDDMEPLVARVYEPYAPLFRMSHGGPTAHHRSEVAVPEAFRGGTVNLTFHPVVKAPGEYWPPVPLPAGTNKLVFSVDLFGEVRLLAGRHRLYPDRRSPFAPKPDGRPRPEWIPESWRERRTISTHGDEDWRYDLR